MIYSKFTEAAGKPSYVINDRNIPKQATNKQISNQPTSSSRTKLDAPKRIDQDDLIELTNAFGFKTELLKQFAEGSDAYSGNFQTFLVNIMKYFEGQDTTFGVSSLSYKLRNSMLAMPNITGSIAFKNQLLVEILNDLHMQINNNKIYLMQGIQQLLNTMRYKLTMPSTFTSASQKFDAKTGSGVGPIRLFMLPELDNAPPAMCNVFFPEQIREFHYSRNASSEPTRMVGSMKFNIFNDKNINNTGIYPFKVVPNLDIGTDGFGGYTTEETYRGIKSALVDLPASFITALEKNLTDITGNEDKIMGVDSLIEGKSSYTHITEFTLKEYLKQRFTGRQLTASCEWSPYRMIGFPALLLDNDLALTGIVSSISTTINSQGQLYSSVSFRDPRLIFDQEKNPAFTSQSSSADSAINQYSVDGYSGLDGILHDTKLYSFEKIGLDVYSFLLFGAKSDNRRIDQSILAYLRDKDGDLISGNSLGKEYQNSWYVHEAVRKLRDSYTKNPTQISQLAANWRKLMTKTEYENYLGIEGTSDDYKNGVSVFTNTTDVRKKIVEESAGDELFRPYNLTRYQHIREAMRGYRQVQNARTLEVN